jgi:hypothetical protein
MLQFARCKLCKPGFEYLSLRRGRWKRERRGRKDRRGGEGRGERGGNGRMGEYNRPKLLAKFKVLPILVMYIDQSILERGSLHSLTYPPQSFKLQYPDVIGNWNNLMWLQLTVLVNKPELPLQQGL